MKVDYKKDLRHNYMVISECEEVEKNLYSVKMLEQQTIRGILKLERRSMDNQTLLYYDITARQSMIAIYDKAALTKEKVKKLCQGILDTVERAYEYLLCEDDFLIDPNYIYMEVTTDEPALCYLPGYNKSLKEQLNSLFEYLMNKVDYGDREAVLLVYQLYAIIREKGYTLEHLQQELTNREFEADRTEIKAESVILENRDNPFKKNLIPNFSGEDNNLDENRIPVMMEKLEGEEEVPCYPIKTYLYTVACAAGGIAIIVISLVSKILYNSFGNHIDYVKLAALLLIVLCVEGYLLKIVWDKKNQITKIIPKNEYVDPRQIINTPEPRQLRIHKANDKSYERPYEQDSIITQRGTVTNDNKGTVTNDNKEQEPAFTSVRLRRNIITDYANSNWDTVINRKTIFPGAEEDNPTCLLNEAYLKTPNTNSSTTRSTFILKAMDEMNYQHIPITSYPFFIGKLKRNVDYCLEKDVVSRYHAKITKEEENYFITDLNSTNGTYLNGVELQTYEKKIIVDGDEISFANIKYRVELST